MKQSCWTHSGVEVETQHIVDNVHPTAGEHTHVETFIQSPRDLNAKKQQDNKHVEVILADFSALSVQQASSQGIDGDGNGNIGMEYAL